jgi:hypothetical protein
VCNISSISGWPRPRRNQSIGRDRVRLSHIKNISGRRRATVYFIYGGHDGWPLNTVAPTFNQDTPVPEKRRILRPTTISIVQ